MKNLNKDWRELTLFEMPDLRDSSMEPEKFKSVVSKECCDDQLRFPNASRLVLNLLSLPHSSSAAERIFSLVSNIKTTNRSRLNTETLRGLLHRKNLLLKAN